MFLLALAPSARKAAAVTDDTTGPDPQPIIDEIAAIDAAIDALADLPMGSDAEQAAATAAAKSIEDRLDALPIDDLGENLTEPGWADAYDEMRALHNRLADLAGQPRDDEPSTKRHSLLGGIWNTKRRRGLEDVILDGFYGGLYLAGKAAWFTLKTAVHGAVAAGKLAAPHIARAVDAAAQSLAEGAVQVEAYMRGGKPVEGYTRKPPSKD